MTSITEAILEMLPPTPLDGIKEKGAKNVINGQLGVCASRTNLCRHP